MFDFPGEGGNAIPPVTLAYGALTVVTTLLCASNILSPMSIYFSVPLILAGQVQRIFMHFFFFGASLTIDLALHVYIFIRYSRDLEERSFLNRSVDYLWMLVFGAVCLTAAAIYFRFMIMSSALVFMVTYVWARLHPDVHVAPMMGVVRFRAPYLPWMLLVVSFLSGSDIIADLLGLVVGHLYYYLEYVYPRMRADRKRFLATPNWFYYLCLRHPPSAAERRAADIARGMAVPPLPPAPAAAAGGAGAGVGAPVNAAETEAVRAAAVPQADPEVTRRMREIAERQRLQRERAAAAAAAEEQGYAAAPIPAPAPAPAPVSTLAVAPEPIAAADTAPAELAARSGAVDADTAAADAAAAEPSPEELRQARLRARAAAVGSPNVRLYG